MKAKGSGKHTKIWHGHVVLVRQCDDIGSAGGREQTGCAIQKSTIRRPEEQLAMKQRTVRD